MANKWITALKKWNEGRDKYCIPKRGTPEYDEVRKIMGEMSGEGIFDAMKKNAKKMICKEE
jgi:hypothetical protein